MNSRQSTGASVLLTVGLVLTACTSGVEPTSQDPAGGESASAVPAGCDALRKANPDVVGKDYKVGTSPGTGNYNNPDPSNPNDVVGLEPQVLRAAGACLGFKVTFVPQSFDGLIPSITSKRIDLISSGMYATPERAQQISFVEHMTAATAALLPKGNPKKINSLADTCGRRAAQSVGTVENEIQAKQNEQCQAEGKQPAEVATYSGNDQPTNAVAQGRSDFFLTDAGVAAELAGKFSDKLEVGFAIRSDFAFGYGVDKSNTKLLNALYAALKLFYDDGSLQAAQQKWGFSPEQQIEPRIVTG